MTPQDKVRRALRTLAAPPADGLLLVAVSGGADSLALLHILHTLSTAGAAPRLHVATLDHGLRGDTGAADAAFVAATAQAWGLPVTVGRAQLDPALPGLEARARAARYTFLAETARAVGAAAVATAHHADDQAETVLLHVLRGSGTHGLAGMAWRAPLPGAPDLTLIRPLLAVCRDEIEAYCAAHDLRPRLDASNADPDASLRNRLRLETLPHLRTLNPRIDAALGRLAQIAAADDAYLTAELVRLTAPHETHEAGRITLDLAVYRALHPALQRRWVAGAAGALTTSDPPGYAHVLAAADLAARAMTGAVAHLPGGVRLRLLRDALVMEQAAAPPDTDGWPLLPADAVLTVRIPGATPTPYGWTLHAFTAPPADPGAVALALPAGARVTLRTRRPGDRFAPPGLAGHTKKVKKWMNEQQLPLHLRDQIPLMVINGEVAALILKQRWVIADPFSGREGLIFFIQTQL